MCVGLVASPDFAVVRLVGRMDVAVLLPVARVGKTSVATVKLALERFLSCKEQEKLKEFKMMKKFLSH